VVLAVVPVLVADPVVVLVADLVAVEAVPVAAVNRQPSLLKQVSKEITIRLHY